MNSAHSNTTQIWIFTASPLVALIFIAFVAATLIGIVDSADSLQPSLNLKQLPSFNELSNRLSWGVSALLVALADLIALALILLTLHSISKPQPRLAAQAAVVIAFFVIFLFSSGNNYEFNKGILSNSIYNSYPAVETVVSLVQAGGHSILLGLALSLSTIIYKAFQYINVDAHKDADLRQIARLLKSVTVLLYAGAFALIAGTLESSALYTWAASIVDIGKYAADEKLFAVRLSAINGALYSIFLAAIFIPSYAVLRWIVLQLASTSNEGASIEQRTKWLAENSLSLSRPDQLLSILALFAPVLFGGPGASLLQSLSAP